MGKKNDAVRSFLTPKERYADFFNGSVYGGEQRITADMLEEMDGTYGDGARDLIRRVADGTRLAIFAVENQDSVDYAMPLRMLEYDCKEYKKQVRAIKDKHTEEVRNDGKKPCYWNTRLHESDRLMPVHSVCFYHGSAQWTGPRSLRDMMDFEHAPEGLEERFHDYNMTVICANEVADCSVFRTDVGKVMRVISCGEDGERLAEVFSGEEYAVLEEDTAEVLAVLTDNKKFLEHKDDYKNEGGYNMCKAMDNLMEMKKNEGRTEGRAEGRAAALIKGVNCIMSELQYTVDQAMELLGVPEEEWDDLRAKL